MKPHPAKPEPKLPGFDIVSRYCKNEECPHQLKFGRARFIGYSIAGFARHKCTDCGEWSTFEDEKVFEYLAMPT